MSYRRRLSGVLSRDGTTRTQTHERCPERTLESSIERENHCHIGHVAVAIASRFFATEPSATLDRHLAADPAAARAGRHQGIVPDKDTRCTSRRLERGNNRKPVRAAATRRKAVVKDLDVNSIEGFTTWPPCLASSNRSRMSVPRPLHRTGPNGREDNPTPDSCKPELEDF